MNLLRKIKQALGDFTTIDGAIVLTYHRINDKLSKNGLVVHLSDFKKQMAFLSFYRRQFDVIDYSELIRFLSSTSVEGKGNRRPRTKILITFDDGYRDNYINAFPILKKYKFSALIFLTTDYINTNYKNAIYKDAPWKRDYLNTDEISEMIKRGISFGAHTASHAHLTQISTEKAEDEISKSLQVVRNLTENERPAFCYPYGEYNQMVKEIVINQAASCAFSVTPGINYKGQDLFETKRIDVLAQDNFSSFKFKLTDKYCR